jgi:hypothetical protein
MAVKARGWISLHLVAFVFLLAAGGALVASAAGFLSSTRLLWLSSALSLAAIVSAVLAVTLPRR